MTRKFALRMIDHRAYRVVVTIEEYYIVNILFWVGPKKSGKLWGAQQNQEKLAGTGSCVANSWRETYLTWLNC